MIKHKRTVLLRKITGGGGAYLALRRLRRTFEDAGLRRRIVKKFRFIMDNYGNRPPIFSSIEIETINRCNNTCSFCPVNKNADIREFKRMEEEVFDKILGDLAAINYKGRLNLYSNNEPFLDTRITEFAKKARIALPEAHINLLSNGLLLTLEKLRQIIPFLDALTINNYNDELKLNESTEIIHEYCRENPQHDQIVNICLRKKTEVLYSRGGISPNKKIEKTIPSPCLLPFRQMVVRPDGKISLCCNDAWGQITLGDVTKQSIEEIWYSEAYLDARDKMAVGRQHISICKFCDYVKMMD